MFFLVTSQRTLHKVTVCQLLRSITPSRSPWLLSLPSGLVVCVEAFTRRPASVEALHQLERGFDPGYRPDIIIQALVLVRVSVHAVA